MRQINFRAMGCEMSAFIDNNHPLSSQVLDLVPGWFESWEQALSRFRKSSELNHLNASSGTYQIVSKVLLAVIQAALQAENETGGLVTTTILNALELAGYDQSFEKIKQGLPRSQKVASQKGLKSGAPFQNLRIDQASQSVFIPPEVKLDLGGIAKGWAAQQAMLRLRDFGPALVNAGGDIALSGIRENGETWPVAVADPLNSQGNLGVLSLGKCGVATSGTDYRRWFQNNRVKHHIIDPRTGEPAQTDLMAVTVIAPDVLQAEAASKAVLILGSQAGLEWLENRPALSGVLAKEDGAVIYSSQLIYEWS